MIRTVLLLLLALNVFDALGRDIFVGGSGASDSNSGTSTQPYATIQKAASVAVAGDVIRIRSGVYRETVTPANSGGSGSPIIFMPDDGASVVISGLNVVDNSGWTVHSGNIYKKTITLPVDNPTGLNPNLTNNTTLGSNQIFKDGNMVIRSRWPNAANVEATWDRNNNRQRQQTATWYDGSVTDSGLPSGLVGGTIWIQGWYQAQTKTISGQSGSTITYPTANPDLRMQQWYYVTGTLSLLDQANEWHYDANSDQLYVWQPGGGSPTGIEYKARNWGFDLRGRSNVNIVGLQFMGCEVTGNTSTSSCTIDNARFRYPNYLLRMDAVDQGRHDVIFWNVRQSGVRLIGPNNTVKNSEFKYASVQGVVAGPNAVIQNNLFDYINTNADYGAAISLYDGADRVKVIGNTIRNTGRSSLDWGEIHRDHHLNCEVAYNDMYNWNMLSYDGGATYGGRQLDLTGSVIHHNWIHDSKALKVPNLCHSGNCDNLVGLCAGIYYDQAVGPTTNHHNVMWNNYECDFHTWQWDNERNAGKNYLYNNTFATDAGDNYYSHRSYLTVVTAYFDVMRNNIYRDDVVVNWIPVSATYGDIQNCLMENVNPQFEGTGQGGLAYRVKAGSPAINAGVTIAGITDGSVGVPDIGAYEYGGEQWIPGYKPVSATTPPPANSLPVGRISSPANNATFTQGANVVINATATDSDGSVTKVEFYRGTTKLGEDATSPYTFTWSNAAAGTYSLTVRVTDNAGGVGTSPAVNITVGGTANTPPVVSLTAPANNAQINAGTAITITATASDPGGTVAKVEFFDGASKLGEDTSNPYSFSWNNASAGSHSITAKATDNLGLSTTSTAVVVTVNAVNGAPTVTLTAPANNAEFQQGDAISLAATAADGNGTVAKVEFFQGGVKLGEDVTAPYSFSWANAPLGTYSLTAKATDNQGAATTSNAVTIVVKTDPGAAPPTGPTVDAGSDVELTLPDNSTSLTATISAGQATKFEWSQVSGPGTAVMADADRAEMNISGLVEGTYVFEVVATDASGKTGIDQVTVLVFSASEISAGAIPRFFSPNNDGNGDTWTWSDMETYENSKLTVFNRAGEKVYEALPYQNNWDGRSNGKALQDGDYYYVIVLANNSSLKGAVRIIR